MKSLPALLGYGDHGRQLSFGSSSEQLMLHTCEKPHITLGLKSYKSAPACKKGPAWVLCFIMEWLVKTSRKYSPAWKSLRKDRRQRRWEGGWGAGLLFQRNRE